MGLEAATYINQLNSGWPVGASDPKSQGDDHIRLLKMTIQATFPNIAGAVTATHTILNQWTGLAGAYAWTGQHSWTQPLRAVDGLVGTPAFTFASDTDTGFYRLGANNIGVAVNGTLHTSFNTSALQAFFPIWTPDGAVGAPSYSFTNDPDTGIYRDSADSISVAAGGTNITLTRAAGFIIGSGRVFNQDGTFNNPAYTFLNDQDTGIYRVGNNSLGVAAGGVLSLNIESVGTFGVNGTAAIPAYSFMSDTNTGMYRSGTDELSFSAGGTAALTIQAGLIQQNAGVFRFQDGTAGAPSQTYASDLDTGIYRAGNDQLAFSEGGTGYRIGFRQVPRSTTTTTLAIDDVGKCVAITAAINIPASVFSAGDCISIYNDSAGALNITISAGTLRLAGTTTTGTRSIQPRGMATLWFNAGGATPEVICSGNVS